MHSVIDRKSYQSCKQNLTASIAMDLYQELDSSEHWINMK